MPRSRPQARRHGCVRAAPRCQQGLRRTAQPRPRVEKRCQLRRAWGRQRSARRVLVHFRQTSRTLLQPRCFACFALGSLLRMRPGFRRRLAVLSVDTVMHLHTARERACWQQCDVCPRTGPSEGATLCQYLRWFSLPDSVRANPYFRLRLGLRRVLQVVRFRLGCSTLPSVAQRNQGVHRAARVCLCCDQGVIGDEYHVVFQCLATRAARAPFVHLFPCGTTMLAFSRNPDIIHLPLTCDHSSQGHAARAMIAALLPCFTAPFAVCSLCLLGFFGASAHVACHWAEPARVAEWGTPGERSVPLRCCGRCRNSQRSTRAALCSTLAARHTPCSTATLDAAPHSRPRGSLLGTRAAAATSRHAPRSGAAWRPVLGRSALNAAAQNPPVRSRARRTHPHGPQQCNPGAQPQASPRCPPPRRDAQMQLRAASAGQAARGLLNGPNAPAAAALSGASALGRRPSARPGGPGP